MPPFRIVVRKDTNSMPRTHSQAAQFLAVPLTTTVDVGGGHVSYDLETRSACSGFTRRAALRRKFPADAHRSPGDRPRAMLRQQQAVQDRRGHHRERRMFFRAIGSQIVLRGALTQIKAPPGSLD
jgi:hypothetical protein